MAEAVRFQTRARTVDHLGREQIADCPTAISELWKNSYDAYARTVSLHIFDGDPVVACVCDDGHGMSRDEFVNKWLVIGTESKAVGSETPLEDREGLTYRHRQGKKGIGRLSAAYVGSLLLLVTKRRDHAFVAALIDWRIFENPFLILDDIRIPVTTFASKNDLFGELPRLYETLMCNVWGDEADKAQKRRVTDAWAAFDEMERESMRGSLRFSTTQSRIEETLVNKELTERHLSEWEVWTGESSHGTAMVMAGVIPEIEAQLNTTPKSASEKQSRSNFQATLWCFTDPFTQVAKESPAYVSHEFTTRVIGWNGDVRVSIIEHNAGFQAHAVDRLEHVIDGYIDDDGVFEGRVKAFGTWLPDKVNIPPDEKLPSRSNTKVGGFGFYASTMEFDRKNSTHMDGEYSQLHDLLEQFSGMMVFRDGFRVMPYGRIDADYFQIEERRSKHAGREFWNHRRMLGRIAISDFDNPNLKDKAGREGLIDNTASKVFKELVINILTTSARRYFGNQSNLRKAIKPGLNEAYEKRQKEKDREKLLVRKRREFRTNLRDGEPKLKLLAAEVARLRILTDSPSDLIDEKHVLNLRNGLSTLKQQRVPLRLGAAPDRLAPKLQVLHQGYKEMMQSIDSEIREIEDRLTRALETLEPADPEQAVNQHLENQIKYLRRKLLEWERRISGLLDSEKGRINDHIKARLESIQEELRPLVEEVGMGKLPFRNALSLIEDTVDRHESENQALRRSPWDF